MTDRETKRLNELLAKKEAEEKADADFFKQVRKRKAEVMKELGVSDKPAYDWFDQYSELKELADRLLHLCYKDYDGENTADKLRGYVEFREQKQAEREAQN